MRAAPIVLVRAAVCLLLSSCGDDPPGPTPVNLRVVVPTTGVDEDADGYVVHAADELRTVRPNGAAELFLTPGEHEVRLEGIASNCAVLGGAASIRVTVLPRGITEVAFAIECRAVTGVIQVSAPTTGRDFDGDGYAVSVTGGAVTAGGTVFPDQPTAISALPGGSYEVTLAGLSQNCGLTGPASQTVSVTVGELTRHVVAVTFTVECDPTTGDVRLVTATAGDDQDPDGYTLWLDGEQLLEPCNSFYCYYGYDIVRLAPNENRFFGQIAPGNRAYELRDIASNCSVDGTNPRTVAVSIGAVSDVLFEVVCSDLP